MRSLPLPRVCCSLHFWPRPSWGWLASCEQNSRCFLVEPWWACSWLPCGLGSGGRTDGRHSSARHLVVSRWSWQGGRVGGASVKPLTLMPFPWGGGLSALEELPLDQLKELAFDGAVRCRCSAYCPAMGGREPIMGFAPSPPPQPQITTISCVVRLGPS